MRPHERIRIVKLCAAQQIEAARIDKDPGASLLDHEVIGRCGRLIEIELVLEAAAAAREDRDPQGGRGGLAAQNLGDAGHRPLGQSKIRRLGAHDDTIAL